MRRSTVVIGFIALLLALVAAGCNDSTDATPTPETVEGTLPDETTGGGNEDLPALELTGDAAAGEQVCETTGCGGCHTLEAAGVERGRRPESRRLRPLDGARRRARHPGTGRHAVVRVDADTAADRGRRGVRLAPAADPSLGFPARVAAFACDLDRTLIARDPLFPDRTLAAIRASRAAGIPVIVATGRMFRSVRPYLEQAGITEPVVCYQGAARRRSGQR